ncbi:MAG: N-glycosylase/DNA lyase [Nitrososphaeria archaeon]|nr:N-glycosylase/DNA lyase [Nitrososphaeria archaeon]
MGLERLLEDLRKLVNTSVSRIVQEKIREFKELGGKDIDEIFKELCFCILTAGYNAERSIMIQEKIGDGFLKFSQEDLSLMLRELGHRYPDARARYIVKAREKIDDLKVVLSSLRGDKQIREWLVENIDGVGYKEASHFLRNIGRLDVAIIDFHILDLLERYGVIKKPKTLTKKKYLEIEKILENISNQLNMKLGELDLYLWYLETGKILK